MLPFQTALPFSSSVFQNASIGYNTLTFVLAWLGWQNKNTQAHENIELSNPGSAHQRHLLQTNNLTTPITDGSYCFPTGTCGLATLDDGVSGFVLQGEVAYDMCGYSVNTAGDINGDGISDIIVGAYQASASTRAGKSYVVFGTKNNTAWGNGVLNISNLMDGKRGFLLQGDGANVYAGYSVSGAGDINGDGVSDLIIGSESNSVSIYVVFGSNLSTAWNNATYNLGNLADGQRGFKIQGSYVITTYGYAVSNAGDVNGDGISDIIIGNPNANLNGGEGYIVFGSRNGSAWGNGQLNINNLVNGQRGFKLIGEAQNDACGISVNSAGDINNDGISDIIVGAFFASRRAGKSYLVFGTRNSTAWGNGVLNISSLMDGKRGFLLQGEADYDYSGISISSDDINGDGITDLIVGATLGLTNVGKTYILFGSSNSSVWSNGLLTLSSIYDGQRGFVIQGVGGRMGNAVGRAGDVNGDGISDIIIGAPDLSGTVGASYVLFGTIKPNAWGSGILNLTSLTNGQRGFVLSGEATFDSSGVSVSTAGDINADGFDDLLIGASQDPISYGAGKAYVVFGDGGFQLWNSQLTVYRGMASQLSSQNLNVTYSGPVQFNIASVTHGQFEYRANPGQAITSFNQSDVWSGKVQFVHNGGAIAPICTIHILGKSKILRLVLNLNITYYDFSAINRLTLHQGDSLRMNGTLLNAFSNYANDQVNITINNLQHGQFFIEPFNNSVMQFNLMQVLGGQVIFVHDGSRIAPSYNVKITDPATTLLPSSPSNVTFYRSPLWITNQLNLTQGNTLTLNAKQINVTADVVPSLVLFTITNLQHGQFLRAASNITNFTQQQLLAGLISFSHDNSAIAPSYQLGLRDDYFTLAPLAASISFTGLPPRFINNNLTVYQGSSQILTLSDLSATDPNPAFNTSQLLFIVSNVQHGLFRLRNSSTNVTQFTQGQVNQSQIEFAHDGTISAPSYLVICTNTYQNTTPTAPNMFFDTRPVIINNRLTIEAGDSVVMAFTNLQAVDDYTPSNELFFTIESISHGYFSKLQAPNISVTNFTQQRVRDSEIQFTHDDSSKAPYYVVKVTDGSGLSSSSLGVQVNFKDTRVVPEATGIDYQKLYTSLSSIGGIGITVLGYLWLRKRIAKHRRDFPLANDLRKVLNLEYYDFSRFHGDSYKTKINDFLQKLQSEHHEFYTQLTPQERKSFAVCLGEIITKRNLVARSDYAGGLFGILCLLTVGWPFELKLKEFDAQSLGIATEAVTLWKATERPLLKWPYHSPNMKEKLNVFFCCANPYTANQYPPPEDRYTQGTQLAKLSRHEGLDQRRSSQIERLGLFAQNAEERFSAVDEKLEALFEKVDTISQQMDELNEKMPLMKA